MLNDVSAIADRIVKPRDANASTCLLLTRLPSWRTMPGVQRSVSAILRSGALLWSTAILRSGAVLCSTAILRFAATIWSATSLLRL